VQFGPIFGSHVPLDLVCIMLGTNDCNKDGAIEDQSIVNVLAEYKNKITKWSEQLSVISPNIMFIAPPLIRQVELSKNAGMLQIFGTDAEEKSKKLAPLYRSFCELEKLHFFDASQYCVAAENEGIHLDEENNSFLGAAIATFIKKML
jgi:lysophospholipase L1-like esterase